MSRLRQGILAAGALGILHSSLVPPVHEGGTACRYLDFMERAWPLTHGYRLPGSDGTALLSEYGLVLALTALAWLAAAWFEARRRRQQGTAGIRERR